MVENNDQNTSWKLILERLVVVGATTTDDGAQVDYFSSLVPRHLVAYGRMMGKEYGPETTKEQAGEDWAQTTVVDVVDRITGLEDEAHRRAVRILVHFLDFSMHRAADRADFRESHRLRFDIYELMQELKTLRTNDEAAYAQALDGLRTLEAEAKQA
jgi:hypothetical protein